FLGTTLWSDMNGGDPDAMLLAKRLVHDFHVISQSQVSGESGEPVLLEPQLTVEEHIHSRRWIESSLRQLLQEKKKVVLITHHGVTPQSIHENFQGNALNPAFVSDMSD